MAHNKAYTRAQW